LEPIPKLNFATTHDIWLGPYARMVSTDIYYAVCRDLIGEVIALFDKPRFFHLGMDEELASYQVRQDYAVVRQNDLWWGDLYFYIGEVEKNGVRPWVWSDYAWHKPDVFFRKMPKSVLQSNWYYGSGFDLNTLKEPAKTYVKLYNDLETYGYEQVPTGSNHSNAENFELTVDYCKKVIDPSRLFGFMMAPWRPTLLSVSSTIIRKHKPGCQSHEEILKNSFKLNDNLMDSENRVTSERKHLKNLICPCTRIMGSYYLWYSTYSTIAAIGLFGIVQKALTAYGPHPFDSYGGYDATAVSYGRMASLYPSAGSAYTYVGKGLNSYAGFMAGWAMFSIT